MLEEVKRQQVFGCTLWPVLFCLVGFKDFISFIGCQQSPGVFATALSVQCSKGVEGYEVGGGVLAPTSTEVRELNAMIGLLPSLGETAAFV